MIQRMHTRFAKHRQVFICHLTPLSYFFCNFFYWELGILFWISAIHVMEARDFDLILFQVRRRLEREREDFPSTPVELLVKAPARLISPAPTTQRPPQPANAPIARRPSCQYQSRPLADRTAPRLSVSSAVVIHRLRTHTHTHTHTHTRLSHCASHRYIFFAQPVHATLRSLSSLRWVEGTGGSALVLSFLVSVHSHSSYAVSHFLLAICISPLRGSPPLLTGPFPSLTFLYPGG